jgi:hypothetical protein
MLRHFSAAFLVPLVAAAAEVPAPTPGQYFRQYDTGTLTISKDASGKLTFEVNSVGGNCHECSITGSIEKGVGHGDPWANEDSKCYVSFTKIASGFSVEAKTPDECKAYCGARAGFDGDYTTPPKGCSASEQEATRATFLDLYRSKSYASAVAVLEPLVTRCREFIHWITIDQIRNDLAIAQLRAGNAAQCLKTLQSTTAWESKDEEALNERLPPCDFTNYVDVAKMTWFNRKLCEKAPTKDR